MRKLRDKNKDIWDWPTTGLRFKVTGSATMTHSESPCRWFDYSDKLPLRISLIDPARINWFQENAGVTPHQHQDQDLKLRAKETKRPAGLLRNVHC